MATRQLLEGEVLRPHVGEILITAESGDLAFLRTFNLVIRSELPQGQERRMSSLCAQLKTLLLLLKSVGLVASLRVYAPEHCIVESKPAPKEVPAFDEFPELRVFADSFHLLQTIKAVKKIESQVIRQ